MGWLVTTRPGACGRIWLRHYRAAMAKVGDLLHKTRRTADRQSNPHKVTVGVDGGIVQVPAAQMGIGSARDIEEAMRFAQTSGAGPMVEPLSQANETLTRIHEGKPRLSIGLPPAGDQ